MNKPQFSPDTPVPEAMDAAPGIPRVFVAHRTGCVGCALARFCTLGDVANTYGLSLAAFLSELERAAQADPSAYKGVRNEESL